MLTSIAQSSGPHAFLFERIQKRKMVKTISKGKGTRVARAMGYDVGAMLSTDSSSDSNSDEVVYGVSLSNAEGDFPW